MIKADKKTITVAAIVIIVAIALFLLISQPTAIPIPAQPDLSIDGLPSDSGLDAAAELGSDLGDVYTKSPSDFSMEGLPSETGLDTTTEEGSGELGDVY